MVRANADSVSQGTVKTALDSGKEIFGIFCPIPTPVGTSPIDKRVHLGARQSSKDGTS